MFKFFSKSCEPLKLKDSFLSLYLLYLSMLDRRGDRFTKIIPLPLGIVMKFDLYKFWWLKILKEQLGCDQSQEKIDITKRYIKRFFWGKKKDSFGSLSAFWVLFSNEVNSNFLLRI